MSPKLLTSSRCKELVPNTLVKIDDYDRILTDGPKLFQLKRFSILSQDPGHRFGNPANYFDVCGDSDEEEPPATMIAANSPTPSQEEDEIYQELINPQTDLELSPSPTSDNQALSELYSIRFPMSEKPVDKLPKVNWQIDTNGIEPGPRCRWIPSPINVELQPAN